MTRTLALTLFLIVIVSAEALAQRSTTQKPTSRTRASLTMNQTTTVEDRLQNLENDVQQLQSEIQALRSANDQLEADLQSARSQADEARAEAESLRQQLDPLTAAITVSGPIVRVNILEAVTVNTESVVSESYTPGAGNIW